MREISLSFLSPLLLLLCSQIQENRAFTIQQSATSFRPTTARSRACFPLRAGGFEWNDPTEAFDQGVENPYKNPALMLGEEGNKIDPARLLSPRLSGVNLYFIGIMGTGKSKIGDMIARREYTVEEGKMCRRLGCQLISLGWFILSFS